MSPHTTARLISAGRGILCTEDGLAVFTALGPDAAANEARLIAIWSSHDQIVAESVTLREDLNDARSNWEAAAEELRQADAVREQLVVALTKIANWELLETGKTWDDGTPMSYGAAFGSNGERDYFMKLAADALPAAGVTP